MSRLTLFVVALLCSAAAAAQQEGRAVSQANFNLSAGYAESQRTQTEDLRLEANLPLGGYFGINAGLRREWIEATDDDDGSAVDQDVLGGQVGLYARDFGRGLFGAEYEEERIDAEGAEELVAKTYRGVFALYDRAFDLTLRRGETRFSSDGPTPDKRHTASAELAGYGGPNLRLAGRYGFLDVKDDLAVTVSFQPGFGGNALAFEAGYEDTEAEGEAYSGRVVYYFGAAMPLMQRHRQALLP